MVSNIVNTARNLRKRSTNAERLLWKYLKTRQLDGLKFRRQEPIGNYIVDFVCYEKDIVIEVDGGQHSMQKEMDKKRDNWLFEQGFKVLRFWNNEVLQNIRGVLEVIRENCCPPRPPRPPRPPLAPPIKGGEDGHDYKALVKGGGSLLCHKGGKSKSKGHQFSVNDVGNNSKGQLPINKMAED